MPSPLGSTELESACARLKVQARPACILEAQAQAESWVLPHTFQPGSPSPPPGRRHFFWNAQGCRQALTLRSALRYRARLYQAVAANAVTPDRDFAEDEATTLLEVFSRDEPAAGPSWLVEQFEAYLATDEQELHQVEGAVAAYAEQYHRHGDEAHFERLARPAIGRLLILEQRVPRRRLARDRFHKAFAAGLSKTCGGAERELISGVAEAWASDQVVLCDPSEAVAVQRELELVESDLGVLAGVGVEPGLRANRLIARRRELNETLVAAQASSRAASRAAIQGPVHAALAGSLAAWGQVAAAISAHPECFEEGLAAAFLGSIGRAMIASDPVSFGTVLCGAVHQGPGREAHW